jgi:exopolyphosphatase/guanosine-5'-triphosphate,3'-diphosphate pyrophosphatase
MREHGGVEVACSTGEEEARLAFLGATRTLGRPLRARRGRRRRRRLDRDRGRDGRGRRRVVASFAFGSGFLADAYLGGDPPAAPSSTRSAATPRVLRGIDAAAGRRAVAVGGSAASLRRLVGDELDRDEPQRALELLRAVRPLTSPSGSTRRPAGAADARGPAGARCGGAGARKAPQIGRGGLREGVLLELAGRNKSFTERSLGVRSCSERDRRH